MKKPSQNVSLFPECLRFVAENESLDIYEKDTTSLGQEVEKEEYIRDKESIEMIRLKGRRFQKWINNPTQINSQTLGYICYW